MLLAFKRALRLPKPVQPLLQRAILMAQPATHHTFALASQVHALQKSKVPFCCRSAVRSVARDSTCKAAVKFSLQKRVEFGDKLRIVGSHDALGSWNVDQGPELVWSDGDVWNGEVSLPDNEEIEFKLVTVRGGGHLEWEQGENHKLSANGSALAVNIFPDSGDMQVEPYDGSNSSNGAGARSASAAPTPVYSSDDDFDMSPKSMWQGREVQFMQENRHHKERQGAWKTDGLEGALLKLVKEDEKRGRCAPDLHAANATSCCLRAPILYVVDMLVR